MQPSIQIKFEETSTSDPIDFICSTQNIWNSSPAKDTTSNNEESPSKFLCIDPATTQPTNKLAVLLLL